jgi:hypothetical protein
MSMATLDDLRAFDIDAATVSLWVFRGPRGASDAPPAYTGYWVETTDDLDAALKETVAVQRDRIEETLEYDLLAQNNETSALLIGKEETNAGLLTDIVAAETGDRRVRGPEQLVNAAFYLMKLIHNNDILYAVRRTTSTWKTAHRRTVRSLLYDEHQLSLDNRPRFDLETDIDFFVLGQELLILHKGHFESTLRYKVAHANDFLQLQQEVAFSGVFVDLAALILHVGVNKLRLRRMSAVRQKAYFRNAQFMERLRQHSAEYGFTFQFAEDGKIIATNETSPQVITALLDHRLVSGFSGRIYDVPSTVTITVNQAVGAIQTV